MTRRWRGIDALAAVAAVFLLAARIASGEAASPQGQSTESRPAAAPARSLTWRTEEGSVALLCDDKMAWQHVHDRSAGKPYMRLALLDGTELTRPWPFPKDYKPNDHVNHKALWWSWHFVGGLNVWEQNAKGTFAAKSHVERRDDGSAVIAMEVVHGPDAGPPLVRENRTVSVGAPDAAGMYLIEWEGVFTPAGAKDVFFKENWYGGFAMRCAGEMRGKDWQFFDHEGRKDDEISRQTARWVAMAGTTAGGQEAREATVAIFDHPSNPRHPAPWCVIKNMSYFNPAFTGAEDYTLNAGASLTLRYGVLVAPAKLEAAAVERHWKMFSERPRKVEHQTPPEEPKPPKPPEPSETKIPRPPEKSTDDEELLEARRAYEAALGAADGDLLNRHAAAKRTAAEAGARSSDGQTAVAVARYRDALTVLKRTEQEAQRAATKPPKPPPGQKEIAYDLGNGVKLEMVLIGAGEFMMGEEPGDKPVHKVTISKPFYLGKYEVTQEQWEAVMGNNLSKFKGAKNPVERVSWDDCQGFLKQLNEKVSGGRGEFRLPTEAQWEYACRAGSKGQYCFGDDAGRLGDYAWYEANSQRRTHAVGEKLANAWGLYDMHGNVWEWCAEGLRNYSAADAVDPTGPAASSSVPYRVRRGGSWGNSAGYCRSSRRSGREPSLRIDDLGFRVAAVPSGE